MKTQESDLLDGKRLKSWLRSEGAEADSIEIIDAINSSRFHPFGIYLRRDLSEKISVLKKGDKVVMHTCMESENPKYAGKIWTCKTDAFRHKGHYYCSIFLEGFSGSFSAEYLQIVALS